MEDEEQGGAPQNWRGTSMNDLYRQEGPWNFACPSITPSRYHHVLCEVPVTLKDVPKPHRNSNPKDWDDDFVRKPYSGQSLFVVKKDGAEIIKPRWEVITEALSKPIGTVEELEKAINAYNNKLPRFTGLLRFFNEELEEEEAQYFFAKILPKIIRLALDLPDILPGSLPLLKKNHCKSISLSQVQVAALLANAFLCTLIWRKESTEKFPSVNFVRLFAADDRVTRQSCVAEKLKCIIHYFRRVTDKRPVGVVTFERKFIPRNGMPRWDTLENNLGDTNVHVTSTGTIEEGLGLLQVDFANKIVGGGVLGYGCVQEEIRFSICPELIISRLFTEELGDSEALIVLGVERYSSYSGYADTFKWTGNVRDDTPFDDYGRRRTTVAVIDATRFSRARDQFQCSIILRELNKAYVGFSSREKSNLAPVATGNWGCGAFKGDPKLKSLIQLMACGAAGRDMVYYSFGDAELRDDFYNMHLFLASNRITICQLWRYLCRFCGANLPQEKLYAFVQQSHFDMKNQPTLKQFLCCNTQKKKIDLEAPSVSTVPEKVPSPPAEPPPAPAEPVTATSPKKTTKGSRKSTISPQEIIDIFKKMEGGSPKPRENGEVPTLLSEIDKMKRVAVVDKQQLHHQQQQQSTQIQMEVDETEEAPKSTSFLESKKRRITDYFSKVTNHVNSYL